MSKMDELIDRFPFLSRTIFRHLDVVNLNRCRLVCKKWKAAIEGDQYFWDSCFEILKEKKDWLSSKVNTERLDKLTAVSYVLHKIGVIYTSIFRRQMKRSMK